MRQKRMKYIPQREEKSGPVPGHMYLFNWVMRHTKGKSAKLLDIGCWNGPLEVLFEKTKHHVTGIDLEESPLLYARKRFPRFRFVKANIARSLPFKKGEFDAVLYFMVIEHIPKKTELKSLTHINRVLKKDGLLFMNTMNDTLLSNFLDPAYLFGHRLYKRRQLEKWLDQSGFRIEEVYFNAGFYTTFYIVILYIWKHILRRKEPRNVFLDALMKRDYRNKGFAEIDILARKVRQV